jgi:hypothetical protein
MYIYTYIDVAFWSRYIGIKFQYIHYLLKQGYSLPDRWDWTCGVEWGVSIGVVGQQPFQLLFAEKCDSDNS